MKTAERVTQENKFMALFTQLVSIFQYIIRSSRAGVLTRTSRASSSWRAVPFLLALSFFSCSRVPFSEVFDQKYNPQFDCGFVQNVYGERISWKGQLPISFYLHESIPAEYTSAIERAMTTWEKAAGRRLFSIVSYRYSGPLQPRQDGMNVIYWMNSWEANRPSEQGRTSVYWVGNQIKETDVRINAYNFTYYTTSPSNMAPQNQFSFTRAIHLDSLMIHELGHVLGLKHTDDPPSVMATYLAMGTNRSELTNFDVSSLQCEY
jgi:hypothetical protein